MSASAPPAIKTTIEDAGKQLADLRRRLGVATPGAPTGGGFGGGGGGGGGQQQNVRAAISAVKGQLLGSHSAPSEQQMRALIEGRDDLSKVIADTNALISKMPALYDQIGAGALKPAALKPLRPLTTN
jgi:hypothetical protein